MFKQPAVDTQVQMFVKQIAHLKWEVESLYMRENDSKPFTDCNIGWKMTKAVVLH